MIAAVTTMPSFPVEFQAVSVNFAAIAPMLVVIGGSLLGVLVEAFAPRSIRRAMQFALALITLVVAFGTLINAANHNAVTLGGSVAIDGPAIYLQGLILVLSAMAVLTFGENWGGAEPDAFTPMGSSAPGSAQEAAAARAGLATSEVFPLLLLSVAGGMLFVASSDLITLFVALEVLSLPLYVLVGLARRRRLLSQEASIKYFLLGAFASAFLLFGAALLYGFAGTSDMGGLATAIVVSNNPFEPLLLPGILLVFVGLLFKVAAVPFHMWTPDVYQGAPTPVTGFMAAVVKVAAFGAMLRFGYVAVEADRWDWRMFLIAIAAITMLVGAVLSVTQTDIKRLLAYSSIAHAGFIMVAFLGFSQDGITGVLFYLTAYGISTIGAFAIVTMVRSHGAEATHLSQWAGLGKSHPVVAGTMSLLLLSFAGIPLTSGFTAKYAAFAPALAYGGRSGLWLVIVAVISSAITAFVYVRFMVVMYFTDTAASETDAVIPSWPTTVVVTISALATIVLGIVPGPVLDLVNEATLFLR